MTSMRGLLLAAILSACGCATSTPSELALDCGNLKKVIETAGDFSAIAGRKIDTRYGSSWQPEIAVYGENCSLVGSSANKPRRYFCSVREGSQAAAVPKLESDVARCLGPEWQRTALPGVGSSFMHPGTGTKVSVGVNDATASRSPAFGLMVVGP